MDVPDPVQMAVGALLDHRAEVDGIDQFHIRMGPGDLCQCRHNVLHALAVVLPAVAGHKEDLFAVIRQCVQLLSCKGIILAHCCFQGVDNRIPCDEHALCHALPAQILPVILRGAEIEIRNGGNKLAVHLLRIGGVFVIGPKPCLHMANRDLVIEGGEGPGKSGGGVPVDQDHVGL